MANITVKQGGRNNWSVYSDGILVEGGFFCKERAEECARELETAQKLEWAKALVAKASAELERRKQRQ